MAAQLIATKGLSALILFLCIFFATTSLPVPLSPDKRTVISLFATSLIIDIRFFITEDSTTILLSSEGSILSITLRSESKENGFII